MTTHQIPNVNWIAALGQAAKQAVPGDVIVVNSVAKQQLAEIALKRLGRVGVKVEIR